MLSRSRCKSGTTVAGMAYAIAARVTDYDVIQRSLLHMMYIFTQVISDGSSYSHSGATIVAEVKDDT